MKTTPILLLLLLALLLSPIALAEDAPSPADPVEPPVMESAAELCEPDEPILSEASYPEARESDFPDASFRACLFNNFDVDRDGALSDVEIAAITSVDVSDGAIADLTGVEKLINLRELVCYGNEITSLNLSANPLLEELYCYDNPLSSLDVSRNPGLRMLYCDGIGLQALDVSANPLLEELYCYDNAIAALDVSNCPNLKELDCHHNRIPALDVTRNPALNVLDISLNPIASVDISACPTLVDIVNVDANPPWYDDVDRPEADALTYVACYQRWIVTPDGGDACLGLTCNADVLITGGNPAAPVSSANVIPASRKTNRVKITARPGDVYWLNLAGPSGSKFKSSKPRVATVNANGHVTVTGYGKTKITFKVALKKRIVKRKVILTVADPTVPTDIRLNLTGTQPARVGESVTLTYSLPDGTDSAVKWKSSNKKVATVVDGVVCFKKAAKKPVTITATTVRGKRKARVKFEVRR